MEAEDASQIKLQLERKNERLNYPIILILSSSLLSQIIKTNVNNVLCKIQILNRKRIKNKNVDLGRNKVKGLLVGYRDVLYLKMHKYLTPELDTFTLKKTCSIKLFYFTFSCNISNINYCLNFVSIEYVILCQIHQSQRDNSTICFIKYLKYSFLSILRT